MCLDRTPQLVSFTSPGARIFVWAYFGVTAALGLWTLADATVPVLVFVDLVAYAVVCAAVTLDQGERLSLPTTIAAITIAPLSVLALSFQIAPGGYTAWYVGAATALLFFVALRGRIALAWIGCAFFVAALLAWGALTPVGLADPALTATRQSAILAVGTLTALGLRRTAGRIRALAEQVSVRGAAEAAGLAAADERSRRLAELRTSVVPLLERIADPAPLTDDDRREFAAAEADLRDGLRARGLRQSRLVDAAREARARGIDVVLLDDSDPEALDAEDLDRFADVVVSALHDAADGRVTARLLPPGRPSVGTVVADGSEYARHEVPRS